MIEFFERVYYNPNWYHRLISYTLLPLSFIYGGVNFLKTKIQRAENYGVKIISIGNILVGGSGKTPFAIEVINHFYRKYNANITYISRGYGRGSKGLVWVKRDSIILTDVVRSGDEAMLVSKSCNCNVIVSEDRKKAILEAKRDGANLIILDDAFSKVGIEKFDIILEPEEYKNSLTLPSGPLREFRYAKKRAHLVLKEGIDFKRVVTIKNRTDYMLLVTAIANPSRLDINLPKNLLGKYILKDHSYFNKDKIIEKMEAFAAKSILVTQKDLVKLDNFNLPISLMELRLDINKSIFSKLEEYYETED